MKIIICDICKDQISIFGKAKVSIQSPWIRCSIQKNDVCYDCACKIKDYIDKLKTLDK